MATVYNYLIPLMWCAWGIYWLIAARDVKASVRVESTASRAAHLIPLFIAAMLLSSRNLQFPLLYEHFVQPTPFTFWLGAAVVLCGLVVAVWSRAVLGRNWSGVVTVKQDHELVRRGPYRWVRHPIYTGLLLGFLGTAIALTQWRGLLAVLIVFVALWGKLRHEERWLGETFGAEYAKYRNEVAALIPFVL